MILGKQTRPEGCITDLKFDAWFAGELSVETREAIEAHLVTCDRCRERQIALSAEREAFLNHPSQTRQLWRRKRSRPMRLALVAAAAASFGLVAGLFLFPQPRATEIKPALRLKGGPYIGFFVQHGKTFQRGTPDYTVYPNDHIRFVYTSPRSAYLAIYGLDAQGTASLYFPGSDLAELVPAGSEVAVNSALELDDVLGPEKVFAIFCEAAFRTIEPKRILATKGMLDPSPNCRVYSFTWNRERAP